MLYARLSSLHAKPSFVGVIWALTPNANAALLCCEQVAAGGNGACGGDIGDVGGWRLVLAAGVAVRTGLAAASCSWSATAEAPGPTRQAPAAAITSLSPCSLTHTTVWTAMTHETSVTEEEKDKRHFRRLNITTITGIILAVLIYNLQDYITPIIESHDICKSDEITEISLWIFPRVNTHCNEILYTSTGSHPHAGIAVIIDLYTGGFVIYLLSISVAFITRTKPDEYLELVKTRWYKSMSKNHATLMILLPFSLIILFFVAEGLYFGYPLVPDENTGYLTRSMSILHSEIGFGAATQIFPAVAVSIIPETTYMFYVLVKEDMTRTK